MSRTSLEAMKVGPWGGSKGTPRDISRGSKPRRLETITIYSIEKEGECVYGLSFEYVDQREQTISVGTFGSNRKGNEQTISLDETEYVYHVSGTMDKMGVTSLKFLTSTDMEYGPYGFESGIEFSLPLDRYQGKVVGFFGRSTDRLVALGAYVLPGTNSAVKVGPWGARSGTPRNPPNNRPRRLLSITVNSAEGYGGRIYGLSFEYVDMSGQIVTINPPWGSTKGFDNTITLANREYVNYISGTTDEKGVTSLNIETTTGAQYSFGYQDGTAFSMPMNQGNATALSFFGLANGNCLVALGTYLGTRA